MEVWLSFLGRTHKRHVFLVFGELWFVKVQSLKAQTISLKAKNICFLCGHHQKKPKPPPNQTLFVCFYN
jgi:hypothetical protein